MKPEIPASGEVTVVVTRCAVVDLLEQALPRAGASNAKFARAFSVVAAGGASRGA